MIQKKTQHQNLDEAKGEKNPLFRKLKFLALIECELIYSAMTSNRKNYTKNQRLGH